MLVLPWLWSLTGFWNPVGYHTDVLVGGMALSSLQNSLYCKIANKTLLSFVTQLAKTTSSLGFCVSWESVPLPPAAVQSLTLNLVY